ncbi:IS66 family transposase [Sporosarcina ureae]|uniref:IS66 family transposase n=1 Tax=Sporosarcina ureae TaxID=1571 RepID=UPI0028B1865C|nr:transposase [Sporosarcina ureae]
MPHPTIFLQNGRLEIDNNRSERAIKTFVIGREMALLSFDERRKSNRKRLYYRGNFQKKSVKSIDLLNLSI